MTFAKRFDKHFLRDNLSPDPPGFSFRNIPNTPPILLARSLPSLNVSHTESFHNSIARPPAFRAGKSAVLPTVGCRAPPKHLGICDLQTTVSNTIEYLNHPKFGKFSSENAESFGGNVSYVEVVTRRIRGSGTFACGDTACVYYTRLEIGVLQRWEFGMVTNRRRVSVTCPKISLRYMTSPL